jgi:FdhE protein
MKASLDDRIARAAELAEIHPAARGLLSFYRELALFQKPVAKELQSEGGTDIRALVRHFPALLDLVRRIGPAPLAEFGARHLQGPAEWEQLLLAGWEGGGDSNEGRFYARVLLQPYAEYLASRGDIRTEGAEAACPFCNARPVVAVLRGEGDGAKRWLLCSLCATEWQYRRVLCPNCGQENKDQLPIYTASDFEHVRVEACDTCKTYLKSVDLTRDGHAVPVVDELATVALNLWADEHGYTKFEANLLGL